jgi:two-component system, cell cycle response regulator
MARILTVDDSRSVRMIVLREVQALGYEVDEAEDGEKGLQKLTEGKYDLVILDVTMPVLDGPGMLAKMRERGDKTPVLMLTSESKRSIIAAIMKSGISDYILKPFKPEELQAKIQKALNVNVPVSTAAGNDAPVASPSASVVAAGAAAPADGKVGVDILVIDDMENVQKRLRQMVPEHISIKGVLNAQTALSTCRDRVFRVILIDNDMPDVNSTSLMRQIRVLQPRTAILALFVRTHANVADQAKKAGFDGALLKPFDAGSVDDFIAQYFNAQELVVKDDNILKIAAFRGRENRMDSYFNDVTNSITKISEDVAAACFAELIVDISEMPAASDRFVRLVLDLKGRVSKMGLELRLVGSTAVASTLKNYSDTADVPLFHSIGEARAAA